MEELPQAGDALLGAGCTLSGTELRSRLALWRGLRERATGVEQYDGGLALRLPDDEPIDGLAALVMLEAACCPFYRFTLEVAGPTRRLAIDAGTGRGEAVAALLGMA